MNDKKQYIYIYIHIYTHKRLSFIKGNLWPRSWPSEVGPETGHEGIVDAGASKSLAPWPKSSDWVETWHTQVTGLDDFGFWKCLLWLDDVGHCSVTWSVGHQLFHHMDHTEGVCINIEIYSYIYIYIHTWIFIIGYKFLSRADFCLILFIFFFKFLHFKIKITISRKNWHFIFSFFSNVESGREFPPFSREFPPFSREFPPRKIDIFCAK